jgi:hypothetical protein
MKPAIKTTTTLAMIAFGVQSCRVMMNPVLFANEDKKARVFIDGSEIHFTDGNYHLFPCNSSYVITVKTPKETIKRRIYPWEPESDSGGVFIDKKGVFFTVVSHPVD